MEMGEFKGERGWKDTITYLMTCGASWLSLSLALLWARRTGRMNGTLHSSIGGLKSFTTRADDGDSSLRTVEARRRILVGPCSGSRVMERRRLKMAGLRLCVCV